MYNSVFALIAFYKFGVWMHVACLHPGSTTYIQSAQPCAKDLTCWGPNFLMYVMRGAVVEPT